MTSISNLSRSEALNIEAEKSNRRLKVHSAIAEFIENSSNPERAIASAREQIEFWANSEICGEYYINEWSRIINDRPALIFTLRDDSPESNQLRQNSPFFKFASEIGVKIES